VSKAIPPHPASTSNVTSQPPIAPFDAIGLEQLLFFGEVHRAGRAYADGLNRGMLDVLREVTQVFVHSRLDFALTGALARAFYARPRVTLDADFVCLASQQGQVTDALQEAGFSICREPSLDQLTFVDPGSSININIHLGAVDPDLSAASYPRPADFLGISVPVIRAEYLLWRYCLSADNGLHLIDAIELLKSARVDLDQLNHFLQDAGDARSQRQLSRFQAMVRRELAGGSYSDSVVRRLRARTSRQIPVYRLQWPDDQS
jgi:hypothetical protein